MAHLNKSPNAGVGGKIFISNSSPVEKLDISAVTNSAANLEAEGLGTAYPFHLITYRNIVTWLKCAHEVAMEPYRNSPNVELVCVTQSFPHAVCHRKFPLFLCHYNSTMLFCFFFPVKNIYKYV